MATNSSGQLPDPGKNARKFKEHNFMGDIPTGFECALTNEIMSDPVYDPNHPDNKFERSAIMQALRSKEQNPFTRTPLTEQQLVSDTPLQAQINNFVENTLNELKEHQTKGRQK